MEYGDPMNYHQPQPQQTYQPAPLLSHSSSSSSSFSFLPNPNPNPISINSFENPFPYPSVGVSTDDPRPLAFEPYPTPSANPYAPHPPIGGPPSIAAQSYQQEASDYYYQLHQQQLYASSSSFTAKVGSGNAIDDLAIKKLRVLQCGAPAVSVRICSICNVVCNSDKVFAYHIAGEKHKLKAGMKPKFPSHTRAVHFTKRAKLAIPKATPENSLISFVGSSVCEICKIDCTSQEVLNNHKLGKKHTRNVQKLHESINPNPTDASTISSTPATMVDLETKKKKVLNGGAAAGAVRVCTQCNVVCNSEEVYNSHIVGKKHLAMVSKQEQPAPV